MAMQQQFDEDDFRQSGGGWWIKVAGIIVYMAIIVAYAIQTMQLVSWLFPADNWFMKGVTVFVCDGCATGYAMAEMFYRFKLRKSKHLVFGMWIVTFILSTAATVIQMYLSSTHNIPHSIDVSVVSVAYGAVIVAYVVNIIAITVIIRMEHNAGLPTRRYLDDGQRARRPVQQASTSVQPAMDERAIMQLAQMLADRPDVREAITGQYQVLPETRQTSPLAQTPMEKDKANGAH